MLTAQSINDVSPHVSTYLLQFHGSGNSTDTFISEKFVFVVWILFFVFLFPPHLDVFDYLRRRIKSEGNSVLSSEDDR